MKYRGLVAVAFSLCAIEAMPRREPFDMPHVQHGEKLPVELSEQAVTAASGTASFSSGLDMLMWGEASERFRVPLQGIPPLERMIYPQKR